MANGEFVVGSLGLCKANKNSDLNFRFEFGASETESIGRSLLYVTDGCRTEMTNLSAGPFNLATTV